MIISHRHRYIFVHIPKTGGTSLTLALEQRVGNDDIILADTPKGKQRRKRVRDTPSHGRLWKHSTLADIEGLVDPAIFADYLIFTMVRNPWDRAVSYYLWLREQKFSHPSVTLAKEKDFDGFLRHPLTQRQLSTPAGTYLTDSARREWPGHFLRVEHLDEDLPPLEEKLGFRLDVPHVNRSPREGRPQYGEATAQLLARLAAKDIARFGYAFNPVDSSG